jgi:L,D-transpeptidase catalytic domain/IPT/TIG domain/Putative peptidoglycan binding domain
VVVTSRVPYVKWCCGREVRKLVAIGIFVGLAAALFVLFASGAALAAEPITPTRYEQNDGHIVKAGNWSDYAKTLASGGSYGRSLTSGASVTIYFRGTQLDWISMKGTTTGMADVYLDGDFQETVDLSAPTAVYNVVVWSTDTLPEDNHKVEIVRSSANPSGKYVTLDAVDVVGTLTYPRPIVTGLNPSYGPPTGGYQVVITGRGFHDVSGPDAVTFGGVSATSYAVISPTKITAITPAHALATVAVQVRNSGGASEDTAADDYTYKVVPAPAITSVSPDASSTVGGTSVTIVGTDFIGLSGASAVTFGGVPATSYTVDSPSQITAKAPAHAVGTVDVQVTAAGGSSGNTAADDFTFLTRYDQIDSRLSYVGAWEALSRSLAWKGIYGRANTKGASVTIAFIGERLDWIATKGTGMGKADVYVDGAFQETVDLAGATALYRQDVWSTGSLPSGVHKVRIVYSPANYTGGYINVDAVDVLGDLVGAGRVEQSDSRLAYTGTWATFSTSAASAGSYKRTGIGEASVTVDFHGVSLTWIATKGTTLGKAWVSLDGGPAESIDLSAPSVAYQQKVWETGELTLADHQVKIWRDGANAAGKYVSIDAFEVTGTVRQAYTWHQYEQSDVRLLYRGTWATTSAVGASGGDYKRANTASAVLDFAFSGTWVDLIATTGPGMGKADVSVDGGPAVTVDFSADTTLYRQKVWSTGTLAPGSHRIKISVSPDNPAGAYIDVDAFNMLGMLAASNTASAGKIMWVEQRLKELSYLPGVVDGVFDYKTRGAVIAFEKWEGMTRDGAIGSAVLSRLQTASRPKPSMVGTTNPWIEVNKAKQVLLFCKDGEVAITIPVSTGSASVGIVTPSGTFSVFIKTLEVSPLYHPMAITWAIAIHGYPKVPTYPASHGCVRTQNWDQDVIYPLVDLGTKVYVY